MIKLRKIEINDLESYKYWNQPIHAYHRLNGPYFKKQTDQEVAAFIAKIKTKLETGEVDPIPHRRLISDELNNMIGEVSWSWRSKETFWMEIGIVIFDENFWGKGIGFQAMKLWIDELFDANKKIVRLGLTTWSGNVGMMKLAEKLGMKKEAEYRKARIVDGVYFDSVSYGILREEWGSTELRV